jgi:hypothetical protein
MSTYMEYLYMQHPVDGIWHNLTVTGVPVSIDAVDPTNTPVHLGDTTSDMSGTYSFVWEPTTEGTYTITATFTGDESYGSSWAQTSAIVVASAASPTPTQTALTLPPYEMYTIGTGIAVIIAVAIVGLLILRKRP